MNISLRSRDVGEKNKGGAKKDSDNAGILEMFHVSFDRQLAFFKRLGSEDEFVTLDFPTSCSNYCIFCAHKKEDEKDLSFSRLIETINGNKKLGISKLLLVANDPMLHPKILDIIACAKKAGFSKIEAMSSGDNFSDVSFVKKAKAKGLTDVAIPIYGVDESHDAIVGKQGSFKKSRKGIDNFRKENIGFHLHSLLLRQNIESLRKISDLCYSFSNSLPAILQIKHKKGLSYRKLMPSYTEIVRKFENYDLNFVGYPLCILEKIAPTNFSRIAKSNRDYEKHPFLDVGICASDSIILYSRVFGYEKALQCRNCQLSKSCPGVPANYLEHYDGEQIKPF
jgi:MoaA/NifB/PqqE/SkfB family radical SAM enzyme